MQNNKLTAEKAKFEIYNYVNLIKFVHNFFLNWLIDVELDKKPGFTGSLSTFARMFIIKDVFKF